MTWLLALYPRRWRRRYGEEFRALLASQPFSFHALVDLIAGAIDAWLEPQNIPRFEPETTGSQEGGTMVGTMAKLGCTSGRVAREDVWKSVSVNIGGTLLLTLVWMMLRLRFGGRTYLDAFSALVFLEPYLFSLRYSSLKGRSPATQSIFIGGMTLLLIVILGTAGWIASRL